MTPNQIVAHNLRRARALHGWTQDAAAERLAPLLGERWSKATFSAAERSVAQPARIRQFSADELVAFAQAFELPIAFFFTPPPELEAAAPASAREDVSAARLRELAGPASPEQEATIWKRTLRRLEETHGINVEFIDREEAS